MLLAGTVAQLGLCLLMPWPQHARSFRQGMFRWIARRGLKTTNIKIESKGPIPQAPFVLVANHLSYMDILVLEALTGTTFIAKTEVLSWPIIGWLTRLFGTLAVNRNNRQDVGRFEALLDEHLKRGESITFFPEATSTDGSSILPFYPSLLQWPAANGFPVHTCSISYASADPTRPASHFVCWWGEMGFKEHLQALINLPAVTATVIFQHKAVHGNCRKALAKAARESVLLDFKATQGFGTCNR